MSKKGLVCGVDIGSSNIRTVIAQLISEEERPRIIGVGISPSMGVRKGIIVDLDETVKSIHASLEIAERTAGVTCERAIVSVGGSHITSQYSKGVIAVGRADGEVTEDDVDRVINAAQAISIPANKEILHIIPKDYSLDDQKNIKDPLGMNGVRLEVDSMIIEGSTPFLRNLTKCVQQTGISIDSLVLSPLAASMATLSKRQKELGVILVDIGGGTTSIAVFEEDELLHTACLPLGGKHITNDIAIGLRTSIDVAEKVKIEFGNANPKDIDKKEDINLSEINSDEEGTVSRYHVAEIIEARLEEILLMVNKELKSIGKDRLLPAGIVLTGGSAKLPGAVDLAKNILGLPAQTGFPMPLGGLVDKVDDPSFVTSVGLIFWWLDNKEIPKKSNLGRTRFSNAVSGNVNDTVSNVKKWLGKFLP
jgi:cell division protein FtsA